MKHGTTCQSMERSTKDVFFLDNDTFFASGNYTDGGIGETGWMAVWKFRHSPYPVWSRELLDAPGSAEVVSGRIVANLGGEIHFFDIKTGRTVDKRCQGTNGFTIMDSTLIYSLRASRELYRLNLKDNSKAAIPSKNKGSVMSLSAYAPDKLLVCRSSVYTDKVEKSSVSIITLSSGEEKNILTGFLGFPVCDLSKTRLLAVAFLNRVVVFDANLSKIYEHDFTKSDTVIYLAFQDNVLRIRLSRNMTYTDYTLDTETKKLQLFSSKFPFYYPTSPNNSLIFSPPETYGNQIGYIRNLKTGKKIATVKLK